MLASQLCRWFLSFFRRKKLPLWLKPFHIVSISLHAGLMETVPSSISIDSLKRTLSAQGKSTSLKEYFSRTYGEDDQDKVRENFVQSMAGYSLFCYLLAIRDRHNGNILIDTSGHVVHVDFGFMFSNSPGGVGLEPVPGFKLTKELVEVMGGRNSIHFKKFEDYLVQGFLVCDFVRWEKMFVAIRLEHRQVLALVEMSALGEDGLPCFSLGRKQVLEELRGRFRLDLNQKEAEAYMRQLISKCTMNWRSKMYDRYQRISNGIQ